MVEKIDLMVGWAWLPKIMSMTKVLTISHAHHLNEPCGAIWWAREKRYLLNS
ncbi:MAG: hypothetical protein F6K47_12750 [Symploca sp. SIO2E6]|nr:hypothetical protein [Symploca sp. SIO2E6]